MNTFWRLLILTSTLLFVYGGGAEAQDDEKIAKSMCSRIASDGSLESPDPIPPEGGVWTCPVTLAAGAGLGVNITLKQLNLDASLGDYLTINAGQSSDLRSSAVFSWKISEPLQLVIPTRDSFFVRLAVGPRTEEQSTKGLGFKLTYDTFETPTPAPTTPTTPLPLPTPPANKPRPSVQVFIGGTEPEKFVERIEEFKEAMANVSNIFCQRNNITLRRPILAEHVQLYDVRKCPFNWPDAGQCVEIVMAVPAFTTSVTPYELSTLHLQQIWNMVRNGNYLPSPWLVYEMPNSTAVIWWACVFFGIVFLFILLIVLAWRVEIHQSSIGSFRKENLDKESIWPKTDITVSSSQVQVPPYFTIQQPPEDAPSRKFFSEDRNSYAVPEGEVNEGFDNDEFEDYGSLDIVSSRNYNPYIYENPDAELNYNSKKTAVILAKDGDQSETTL